MTTQGNAINQFIARAQRRLNLLRWWAVTRWLLLAGAVVMLLGALVYVAQGYRVAMWWYAAVTAAVLVAAGVWAVAGRLGERAAARRADDLFHLHDALTSYLGFTELGKTGGFYELQAQATSRRLQAIDLQQLRPAPSRRLMIAAAAALVLALGLGLKGPSQRVLDQQAEAQRLAEQTEQINQDVQQMVEQLVAEAGEDQALLDPSELREWVKQLDSTDNLEDALRQYARFEQKLAQAEAKLAQRHEEQLLTEAGEELKDDAQTRELGEKLVEKDYRKAEEELAELEPGETEKLDEAKAEVARLRAASRQMAAAARAQQRRQGGSGSTESRMNNARQGGSQQANAGEHGGEDDAQSAAGGSSDSEVAEAPQQEQGESGSRKQEQRESLNSVMQQLDDAVSEYERALAEAGQMGEPGDSEAQQRLASARGGAQRSLQDMRGRLRQMAGAREMRGRLQALREALAQSQGGLSQGEGALAQGQSNAAGRSMQQSPGKNGSGVGAGPGGSEAGEQSPDTGKLAELQGIKGEGPTMTTVEEAESGSGSSAAASKQQRVDFQRQVESFVHREDVPVPVRKGVQRYFENIHQSQE